VKRALILGFLCLVMVGSAGTSNPSFQENLARFHLHYDKFMRAYEGCPKGAAFIEECKPDLGTFDYGEFNRAAHEARDLFSLEKEK